MSRHYSNVLAQLRLNEIKINPISRGESYEFE